MAASSLPTRIGRRLFGAFLIVAAVPVITVSIYSLGHFTSVVEEQQRRQLGDAIRSQGHLLLARLEEALVQLGGPTPISKDGPFLAVIATGGERARPAIEETTDGSILLTAASVPPVQGRLNPDWLWRSAVSLPPRVTLCVESMSTGSVLFCGDQDGANHDGQTLLNLLPEETDYSQTISLAGDDYDVSQWELFLSSKVEGGTWRLTAFRNSNDFLGALALRRFLPSLVALSIAMAALFSLILLRRRLGPLHELTEATARVARSEFDQPVVINESDEFSELGSGFNAMMEQLQEQVSRFRINAEIDRLILQSESTETVLNLILGRAFLFIDADYFTIGIIDPDHPDQAVCQSTRASDGQITPLSRVTLSGADLALVSSAQYPVGLDPQWSGAASMRELGGSSGLLVGITWQSQPLGFLLAGMPVPETSDSGKRSQLVELRDRLAVTLTAAEKEKALFTKANFDSLTGLPNRHLLEDRLRLACEGGHGRAEPFALLFLDLDNFKLVNDSIGHEGGDQLLKVVARRLNELCQRGEAVARLGGDEFVLLLTSYRTPQDLDLRAQEVITTLSNVVEFGEHSTEVNASIGIALYPHDGTTPGQLLRNADAAMYRSKDLGRNRVTFFTDDINLEITRKFDILTRLRSALANNELSLAYQPQFALAKGDICGAEVLVRWPGSDVAPSEMIAIAEDYGVIVNLGQWVLEKACADFAGLDETLRPPRISVNVSARQLADPQFVEFVADCLAKHQLSPGNLELEITESLLVKDSGWAIRQLQDLKRVGISLALDDFGTGYSSLTYLQKLPVDSIKIDRSFVTHVDRDETQQGFVTAVVQLAHSLGKETIAEGAETDQEVQKLRTLGCDYLQGYVFSRPLPGIDELAEFMVRRQFERTDSGKGNLKLVEG